MMMFVISEAWCYADITKIYHPYLSSWTHNFLQEVENFKV